jgi:hypothetical protein
LTPPTDRPVWKRALARACPNNRPAKPKRPTRSAVEPHEVKVEAPTTEHVIGAVLVSAAAGNGTLDAITLDRRAARGLLPPSACPNRSPKIEYADEHGSDQETPGVYLDNCPYDLVTNTEGAWTPSGWERLCIVELAEA